MSGVFSKAWEREAFAALVAHPYGMAAAEMAVEGTDLRASSLNPVPVFVGTTLSLFYELRDARARARGQA